MPEIVPAIMPNTFFDIEDGVSEISGIVPTVQIDIMDGVFVEGKTWPYGDDDFFEKIITQDTPLPKWERVNYEIDLMVSDPEKTAKDWISAGASRVIIHSQSHEDYRGIIERLSDEYDMPGSLVGVEIALAVPFDADISLVEGLEEKISSVQVMGISPVGVQGSLFNERAYQTIREMSKAFPNLVISVDGGVKDYHIEELVDAGAGRIVMGSAIFGEESPREALRNIMSDVAVIQ